MNLCECGEPFPEGCARDCMMAKLKTAVEILLWVASSDFYETNRMRRDEKILTFLKDEELI